MPARDFYHDTVVNALIHDGWTVTHDLLTLRWGSKDMFVDLGAEKLLAAAREGRQIGVEIKSFLGHSNLADLEQALGQYALYGSVLSRREPARKLYIAIPDSIHEELFQDPIGAILLEDAKIKLTVFDPARQEITQWIE